ncbi:MAG TPA: phosphatidylserine decarboxylase [Gammaproteobacteria bacterium]|nr:phosphatidylserine decarboxylase [Gammaproteobacteria bacterium]
MPLLPHHLLSAMMYAVTRCEWKLLKSRIIRWAIKHYDVDLSEAVIKDADLYPSFNAFFTRQLESSARPVAAGQSDIVSPVDGEVSQAALINQGRLIQAKGRDYSLLELLGGDEKLAALFEEGNFATIYLSPRDYHRIHMPLDGHLRKMTHVPGRLFSVSQYTTESVPNLFARNERVISLFDTDAGPMAMILVGAIFVGSMETVWDGIVTPVRHRISSWEYAPQSAQQLTLHKGEEMGRFNMGSTVILLFPKDRVAWDESMTNGESLKMGERIGGKVISA